MLLREKDKQSLLQIFAASALPVEVWAYGSRVNGTAHAGSDLDLVIINPTGKPLPVAVLTELKQKIRESNIPILVELFDWERLPESFHRNIVAEHEVLFNAVDMVLNEPGK